MEPEQNPNQAPSNELLAVVLDNSRRLNAMEEQSRFSGLYAGLPLTEETPEIGELAKAMSAFQAACPAIPKSGHNTHFGSKYSTLSDLQTTAYPVLGKHGLSVSQRANVRLGTEGGHVAVIVTTVRHESGQWERHYSVWPIKGDGRGTPSQAIKAALTYAKAGELSAALGVSGGDETDGEHERGSEQPQQRRGGRAAPGSKSGKGKSRPKPQDDPPPPSDEDMPPLPDDEPPPERKPKPSARASKPETTTEPDPAAFEGPARTEEQMARVTALMKELGIGQGACAKIVKDATGIDPRPKELGGDGMFTEPMAREAIKQLEGLKRKREAQ